MGALSWCLSSSPSLPVGLSIKREVMGVAFSAPQGRTALLIGSDPVSAWVSSCLFRGLAAGFLPRSIFFWKANLFDYGGEPFGWRIQKPADDSSMQ